MNTPKAIARLFLLFFLISQTACIGTTPRSQFYLLEPVSADNTGEITSAINKPTYSLMPIRIPHYLDRAQIVTATSKNTYQLDEFHRWAEGLNDNMTRVMLQNLTVMVPADVVVGNTRRAKGAEHRITVTILEFHVDSQGQAVLSAHWQVSKGDETLLSQQNDYRLPVSNDDVQAQVQALNQCLNQFSRDIASALKNLKAG